MSGSLKHYIILNLTVFVWGFTGVLGKEISLDANEIVFFRMGIAFLSLILIGFFQKKPAAISQQQRLGLLATGGIVAIHWFTFFYSIKVSTVSVAVVCMSSATLFTALLEPLIFKRKILASEFVLSLAIMVGITLIIGFEYGYLYGILIGLTSAFLASLFNVLNGKFIQTVPSFSITKNEMLGGVLTMAILLLITGDLNLALFEVPQTDWIYLAILGIICTTGAFLVSVWLMKFLSPFTVSMGLNMEPIYAILIALSLDFARGETTEKMSTGFYVGTMIILGSIFINGYLKKKKSKA